MKIKRNILTIGGSKAITLPKSISGKLLNGDKAIFDIEVVEVLGKDRVYRCNVCGCTFVNEPQYAYCPECESKDLEVIV